MELNLKIKKNANDDTDSMGTIDVAGLDPSGEQLNLVYVNVEKNELDWGNYNLGYYLELGFLQGFFGESWSCKL